VKIHWFKYLLYISIVFLVVALVKADYLVIPKVYDSWYLVGTILLLFAGFIVLAVRWKAVMNSHRFKVSTGAAISSVGLSVFAKYIPGKLMVVLGKAGYINKKYGYPNDRLITLSFTDQFISLWSGLIVGAIGLSFINETGYYALLILVAWIALSMVIFFSWPHRLVENLSKRLFKKTFNIPSLSFKEVLRVMPWFFLYWIIVSIGFYFLCMALSVSGVSIETGLFFPLATTFGIISIIAPGGVGVREGILVLCLTLYGLDTETAVTLSVASRLWFLVGEVFIFLMGVVYDRSKR